MRPGALVFGSLFSGIGGIDLGLELAGMRCAWQVEIDPFCRQVLAKHWPGLPLFEDIKTVDAAQLAPVDVIAGGFPCQDVSSAGKRRGIENGTRSGLWSEFNRLVCEARPLCVIVENVPGLLISGIGRVLSDLATSGYDAEWDSISANSVGAPHIRDRVFITAYSRDTIPDAVRTGSTHGGETDPGRELRTGRDAVSACGPRQGRARPEAIPDTHGGTSNRGADMPRGEAQGRTPSGGDSASGVRARWWAGATAWESKSGLGMLADGVPARMARLRSLGNAVVPQCAEIIGARVIRELGRRHCG